MKTDVVNNCSALLDTDNTTLLEVLYDIVSSEFLDYCKLDEIPTAAIGVLTNMVCVQYNRREAQGLSAQSFSGVSESFTDGYPANIIKQLNRYRRLQMV